MARGTHTGTCMICLTPYRREILSLYRKKVSMGVIYRKYSGLMEYNASQKSFYRLILRHIQNGHSEDAVMLPGEQKISAASIENFGQKMLELGMGKIQNLDPKDVALKDVIAAQKLVLDSKKLKLSESALEAMLGKMFAPPELNVQNAVEGEVVNDSTG